jgi:choline dehydrogenase-like flavoprotein
MFFDANEGDRGRFAEAFDVCVIGAGPAGITLARGLAARGYEVALMEGGGLDVSVESQDLYVGEIVGMDYIDLDAVRLRVFGGCSEHWSGDCQAFDAEAFETMPQRPLAWPIRKADLDPYQPAAAGILDLPLPRMPGDLPMAQDDSRFRDIRFQHSPPTRFGQKYHDEIAAAERIACCLNANLVDLRLGPDLASVEGAVFRSYTPGDPGFTVRARAYCLCLGGLETPRMLLNFTSQNPAGIGNDHDLVGRYFCEHPSRTVADLLFTHPPEIQADRVVPTRAFMLESGTLGFTMRLQWRAYPPDDLYRSVKSGIECATPWTQRMAERLLGRPSTCRWGGVEEFMARRYPDSLSTGWVVITTEQALNPDSRVMLGDDTDMFGLRRMRFDWQLTDLDYHTMKAGLVGLGEHFAAQDIGRVRIHDWLLAEHPRMPEGTDIVHGGLWNGGYHQMCTTRMADDPREGVVDRNCRVHGTDNLYIGGSSVFATPSHCAPTFTIVQLALRLGDHLEEVRLAHAPGVEAVP